MRIDDLTIKPRRVPIKRKTTGGMSVAEYIIVSCELCDAELAIAAPFDGQPVRCAMHDHDRLRFRADEEVVSFEDAIDCD